MDYLSNLNPHIRDADINFDAGPHIYTIKGNRDKKYMSVTTWNHTHFASFDADAIIQRMMANKTKWAASKYFGQTPAEIKAGWELTRDTAAAAGTQMHYAIECFYNGVVPDPPSLMDTPEYAYFQQFEKNVVSAGTELKKPYRTEWMIYDEELQLAGSIDMVFENLDGTLSIYDWKRVKELKRASAFGQFSHSACIEHLPDTNFWHYALQLNTYQALLERNYEKKIKNLYLVCLHPSQTTFQVVKMPDLQAEVRDLFAERLIVIVSKLV